MKRCRGIILAGVLALSLTVPVRADRSVKTELPQDTTDYYMTVDSGGIGVDIYPGTSSKGEKLNGATVKDGTVLHIEGETEKNGETWGYTEYNGTHGYVPLDELRPSKDAELAAAGVRSNDSGNAVQNDSTEGSEKENSGTENSVTGTDKTTQNSDNAAEKRVGNPGVSATDSTVQQNSDSKSGDDWDSNTESAGEKIAGTAEADNNATAGNNNSTSDDNSGRAGNTEAEVSGNTNTENASEPGSAETTEAGSASSSDTSSTDGTEEPDAKHVNGTAAKSFKEDSSWYQNPFIWIGIVTVLAAAGILGYHLKKR